MADIVLVLGNGFDLDLGLESRYSDFAKSDEWKELYRIKEHIRWQGFYNNHSLLSQIEKDKYERWLDLEEEINIFVQQHRNPSDIIKKNNKDDFVELKKALAKYLSRISDEYKVDTSKLSFALLSTILVNNNCNKSIFSFNYTDCIKLCNVENNIFKYSRRFGDGLEYTHVHGALDEDIVLGCEVYDGKEINKDYSFMYKYNMLSKPNKIVKNLLEAKEVIFFGHSINEMDFCYFRDYFKAMSTTEGLNKNLTIICKDEKSAINIRDNIRSQGIIVTDLYNNLNVFDFFHTDMIYKDEEARSKWEVLLKRIKNYNTTPRGVSLRNHYV